MESSESIFGQKYIEYKVNTAEIKKYDYLDKFNEVIKGFKCLKCREYPEFYNEGNQMMCMRHESHFEGNYEIKNLRPAMEDALGRFRKARHKICGLLMMKAIVQTSYNEELKNKSEKIINQLESSFLERCESFVTNLINNKISNAAHFSILFARHTEEAEKLIKELSYDWSMERINEMISIMENKIKSDKDLNPEQDLPNNNEVTFVSLPITTKEKYELIKDQIEPGKSEEISDERDSIIIPYDCEEVKDVNEDIDFDHIKRVVNKGLIIKDKQFKMKDGKSILSLDLMKSKNLHALNHFSKYKMQPLTVIKIENVNLGEVSVRCFLDAVTKVKSLHLKANKGCLDISWIIKELLNCGSKVVDELWIESFEIEFITLCDIFKQFKSIKQIGFRFCNFAKLMDDSKICDIENPEINKISIEHSEVTQSDMSIITLCKIILESDLNKSLKSINTWGTKINNDKLCKIIESNKLDITTSFNNPMEYINAFE